MLLHICQSERERQRIWPFNNAALFSPSHAIQLSWLVCCILSGPCRGWGRCLPASHRWGLAQSVWDLWWIKWHWDRFFFEFISFPLSILFHCGSPYTYITYLGDEQFRDIVSSRWHKLDHAFCASVFLYVRALYWWYCNVLGVLFHDGSLLHSKFSTQRLITGSYFPRILIHAQLPLVF
jgi:hypothetical protein